MGSVFHPYIKGSINRVETCDISQEKKFQDLVGCMGGGFDSSLGCSGHLLLLSSGEWGRCKYCSVLYNSVALEGSYPDEICEISDPLQHDYMVLHPR
jgi:hypothetical protein